MQETYSIVFTDDYEVEDSTGKQYAKGDKATFDNFRSANHFVSRGVAVHSGGTLTSLEDGATATESDDKPEVKPSARQKTKAKSRAGRTRTKA